MDVEIHPRRVLHSRDRGVVIILLEMHDEDAAKKLLEVATEQVSDGYIDLQWSLTS